MSKIIVECKPDEAFIRALGFSAKQVLHQPNKGEVINYLRKNPGSIGVVDEDPGTAAPNYLGTFTNKGSNNHQLELLENKQDGNLIILVKPRLENWIMNHLAVMGFRSSDYFLPDNPNELHKVINYHIPKFKNLLNDLQVAGCPAFTFLSRTIMNHLK